MSPHSKPWRTSTFWTPQRDDAGEPALDETRAAGDVRAELVEEFGPTSNISERDVHRLGLDSIALDAYEDLG